MVGVVHAGRRCGPAASSREVATKVEPWNPGRHDLDGRVRYFAEALRNATRAGQAGVGPRVLEAYICVHGERAGQAGVGPRVLEAYICVHGERAGGASRGAGLGVSLVTVMERLRGETLEVLAARGRLPPRARDAVLHAVRRLHQLGIAHNDLHGGNVLLLDSGEARIIDYGRSATPEQAARRDVARLLACCPWPASRRQQTLCRAQEQVHCAR